MNQPGNASTKRVYRVLGPGLGDGVCLRAVSESAAISAISRIFGLEIEDLSAAIDLRVHLPPDTILHSSGETMRYVPSARPKAATARPDRYGGLWKQTGSLKGCRLLVVEDEYFIAVVIQNHLEAAGAIVLAVGSPVAAVETIKSQLFDAAILDINLHGVKAYPVADMLIARNIPFVISSAYDDWIFCSRYPQVPACQKPYPIETLKNLLLSVLR